MKRSVLAVAILSLFTIFTSQSFAVPQLVNYQGRLTDKGTGNSANGNFSITFTLYNSATDGAILWSDTQSVEVTNGVYNVLLPVAGSVFDGQDVYLGFNVNNDGEMLPRQRIVSVGYAYLSGGVESGGVTADAIADGSITAAKFDPSVSTLSQQSCVTGQVLLWTGTQWECMTPQLCPAGSFVDCYTGPDGTLGVGECVAGKSSCVGGGWSSCQGEVVPEPDLKTDGSDQDCDSADFYFSWPGTGQTGDYTPTYGEDSDFNIIAPNVFSDQGDGTVVAMKTGLMWQKVDDNTKYNWYQTTGVVDATYNPGGMDVCGTLNLGGYTDWRIPTRKELVSLVDSGAVNPAVDSAFFPEMDSSVYWTNSNTDPGYTTFFAVDFSDGSGAAANRSDTNQVMCVRGNNVVQFVHIMQNPTTVLNNGEVYGDLGTPLFWQQHDDNVPRTWEEALSYCASQEIGGGTYYDLRLPSRNELESIVIEPLGGWFIDTTVFGGNNYTSYWTSTTDVGNTTSAWAINFADGSVSSIPKTGTALARCTQ